MIHLHRPLLVLFVVAMLQPKVPLLRPVGERPTGPSPQLTRQL